MNARGVTIAEMLAATAVAGVVLVFALQGVNSYLATEVAMRKQVGDVQDVSLVKLKLGLGVGGGNLRTYFWTGNGPVPQGGSCGGCVATGTDALLGRMIVPVPNKCRDLRTECPGSVTIVSATPNVTGLPAYALCMVDGDHILTTEGRPMGPLIGLLATPRASLFYVTGPAQAVVDLSALDPTCSKAIALQFRGAPPAGSLFSLPIRAAIAGNFTSGTCVCAEDKVSAVAEYPARMMNVDVNTLGLMPNAGSAGADQAIHTWGINRCTTASANSEIPLDCARSAEIKMNDVLYVETDEKFQVHDPSAPDLWYSLNPSPDPRFCIPGKCRAMKIPAKLNVRLPGEAPTQLVFSTFSLLKQDVLKRMRFQVLQTNGKVQTAEIQF